jgi:hypothetical protein
MAGKIVTDFIKMQLFKKGGAIASDKAVQFAANALEKRLINLGIDPRTLNNQTQLKQLLAYVKQAEDQQFNQLYGNVLSGEDATNFLSKAFKLKNNVVDMTGKKIPQGSKIMGGEEVVEGLSDKEFQDLRRSFRMNIAKNSPDFNQDLAKRIINRELYKDLSDTQRKDFLDNLDFVLKNHRDGNAQGGRAGYYTGGITDVKPDLSDIGHGSDTLMARTRLLSPNNQATTSTGLNYLLAEDNDNIRVPFASGTDLRRRLFLKLIAALTGGIAAVKSGITGLGKTGTTQATKEVVKQSAGSSEVPPYFFKLVEKIRANGVDTLPSKDKTIAKKYKDYVMEEDFAGNIEIIKKNTDEMYPEEVYMKYTADDTALPDKKGFTKVEEYEEFTAKPDMDGKMKDIEQGVPDEVVNEGSVFEETITKKADGGRIGFRGGKLAFDNAARFLRKVFGKEMDDMATRDPELYQGLMEVVDMYRARDMDGLKAYMKKFLPHMDEVEIEEFIVGTRPDIEGMSGELLRLGSGRDYKAKIEMIKQAENASKLKDFDVEKLKPNAEGGRISKWMGGGFSAGKRSLSELLKYMSKGSSHGKTPSDMLKLVNPKQLNELLNKPEGIPAIAKEMVEEYKTKMTTDRAKMLADFIGTGKRFKKVDDDIIKYKMTIIEDMVSKGVDRKTAESAAEVIASMAKQQSPIKNPPKITEKGLLEMENMQKNLLTKDRKLQATGGLTTMLGE